ncbi:MAG: hypothetical protein HC800_21710 [Phormidesmis sp. RL_2_1]|nr:hypothetical protein [Phormidesmis sp. RL_2_1]
MTNKQSGLSAQRMQNIQVFLASSFWDIASVSTNALPLYDQALTHSRFAKEQRDQGIACADFERLEFLGDRILNCAVADFLYRTYAQASQGILSEKIKFVQNSTLAHLVKTKAPEIRPLIRLGNNQKITEAILADTFEALIGAIYLDTAQGFSKVRQVVSGHLATEITSFDTTEDYIVVPEKLLKAKSDGCFRLKVAG